MIIICTKCLNYLKALEYKEEIKKNKIIDKIKSIRNCTDEMTNLHKICIKSIKIFEEI